ncbi:AraC family transcriptional regulator [Paenibacillus sp. SYP-B3998]|uniref:AraC family transcriptional regulator n=1 Tax=Paenibacillus sp. SYP-B3998 TaxID=2678564 RepID=A0A6G3ZTU7_9BACL|nr:helix-turn-helix domain-containing protein [Paenibacillus sp. SYP-B3998]NEW05011.1 AraC family transcriptional regulator [Paenibacillus sp. SYP-B3998]
MQLGNLAQQPRPDMILNRHLRENPYFMKYEVMDTHFQMDFHMHIGYEIYFFHQGEGSFLVEDRVYGLAGNDMILVNPLAVHKSFLSSAQGCTRTVINFLPELVDAKHRDRLLQPFDLKSMVKGQYLCIGADAQQRIFYLLKRMYEAYSGQSGSDEMAFCIYLNELLLEIYRLSEADSERPLLQTDTPMPNSIVDNMMQYLAERYANKISLDHLADHFFLNKHYICHLFKKKTGYTITQFLLHIRIRHAKKYLTYSDLSISEIAGKVGFNSFSNFAHDFKKVVGIPPTIYRKNGLQLTDKQG